MSSPLRSVAGDVLPADLYQNDYVSVRVFADTLRLHADGTGSIATRRSTESLQAGVPGSGPTNGTTPLHYRVLLGRAEITMDCPMNANCAAGPHFIARRLGDGLRMDFAMGERVPLDYTAVDR